MKILKSGAAIIISVVMIMGLAGCNEVKEAEDALNSVVTALQAGDFEKADRYINNTDSHISAERFGYYRDEAELRKSIFSRLSYKINSSEKVDNDRVKMNVEFTNVNMENVLNNAALELFSILDIDMFSILEKERTYDKESMSGEELENTVTELIAEGIQGEKAGTVTNTVDVNAVKTDEGWKIDADDAVTDAMAGGLFTFPE